MRVFGMSFKIRCQSFDPINVNMISFEEGIRQTLRHVKKVIKNNIMSKYCGYGQFNGPNRLFTPIHCNTSTFLR